MCVWVKLHLFGTPWLDLNLHVHEEFAYWFGARNIHYIGPVFLQSAHVPVLVGSPEKSCNHLHVHLVESRRLRRRAFKNRYTHLPLFPLFLCTSIVFQDGDGMSFFRTKSIDRIPMSWTRDRILKCSSSKLVKLVTSEAMVHQDTRQRVSPKATRFKKTCGGSTDSKEQQPQKWTATCKRTITNMFHHVPPNKNESRVPCETSVSGHQNGHIRGAQNF